MVVFTRDMLEVGIVEEGGLGAGLLMEALESLAIDTTEAAHLAHDNLLIGDDDDVTGSELLSE